MLRASFLNEEHEGFHARSRLLDSISAQAVMAAFPGTKEYSDPILDIEHAVLVLERPVEALNLHSNDSSEDGTQIVRRGATEKLIPYRCWQEGWSWERIANLCDAEKWLHWRFSPDIGEIKVKWKSDRAEQLWYCSIHPKVQQRGWSFSFSWKLDRTTSVGTEMASRVPEAVTNLLVQAGISEWVTPHYEGDRLNCVLDVKPSGGKLPADFMRVMISEKVSTGTRYHWIPAEEGKSHDSNNTIFFPLVSFSVLDSLLREVTSAMKAPRDGINALVFQPLDREISTFREWAEPRFGGPWIQDVAGWADKTPSPDDIDDSLPDWVLLPVAHFKILGSWRIITVVKEPGGWRFHVTGKYTKDPLKHRHIRDELARKAGMTSETLWEPQEAGEGWLGVPG